MKKKSECDVFHEQDVERVKILREIGQPKWDVMIFCKTKKMPDATEAEKILIEGEADENKT